jgi:hypothetical protein
LSIPAEIEIKYVSELLESISPAELDLLESVLPDLVRAMMEGESADAD